MTIHTGLHIQEKTALKSATSFTPARSVFYNVSVRAEESGIDGECAECRSKRLALQRQSAGLTWTFLRSADCE